MKKTSLVLSFLLIAVMLFAGCAAKSDPNAVIGKWMSDRDKTVIEFTADGTYKGIRQTDYKYEVIDGKQLKITNPNYPDGSDSIVMDFVIKGDVMTTTSDGTEITWKKVK